MTPKSFYSPQHTFGVYFCSFRSLRPPGFVAKYRQMHQASASSTVIRKWELSVGIENRKLNRLTDFFPITSRLDGASLGSIKVNFVETFFHYSMFLMRVSKAFEQIFSLIEFFTSTFQIDSLPLWVNKIFEIPPSTSKHESHHVKLLRTAVICNKWSIFFRSSTHTRSAHSRTSSILHHGRCYSRKLHVRRIPTSSHTHMVYKRWKGKEI